MLAHRDVRVSNGFHPPNTLSTNATTGAGGARFNVNGTFLTLCALLVLTGLSLTELRTSFSDIVVIVGMLGLGGT